MRRKKKMVKSASSLVEIAKEDHLETLRRCGGYYACPKDALGQRKGPLVGYAGKYPTSDGEKQFVGDIYANFAKAEEYPHVLNHFAAAMALKMAGRLNVDFICGAPIGGYAFAEFLGFKFDRRVIKAEKKVIALATAQGCEQTELVFSRHGVEVGANYAIGEDVCNNFSTTEQLITLIMSLGGYVAAIVCGLNRSLTVDNFYSSQAAGRQIPVISLVRKPIPEYRQDDPAVMDDIKIGNVVWKPKNAWDQLMEAMS
jgi:orotate phosphoribosyltransferase